MTLLLFDVVKLQVDSTTIPKQNSTIREIMALFFVLILFIKEDSFIVYIFI